jgi:hypothetical protein
MSEEGKEEKGRGRKRTIRRGGKEKRRGGAQDNSLTTPTPRC